MSPHVSIGLPVYNGERYLAASLASLLEQDFEDFELIVSDNGSSDGTEGICRAIAGRDRRVRYERQETNQGAAWNYNRVFALAGGQLFKWAAHDDLCDQGYLRTCVDHFAAAPGSMVLCYPRTRLISESGADLGHYDDDLDLPAEDPCQRLQQLLRRRRLCNAVFGMHRRTALARTRLIGSYFSADVVLLAELSLLGQIREIPDYLFARRVHDGSSCNATRSMEEIAAWFDPRNRGRRPLQFNRMFLEHLRAIGRSPLGLAEKLRCWWIVLRELLPAYWRAMGGELKSVMRRRRPEEPPTRAAS